jgi:hypothetical protein
LVAFVADAGAFAALGYQDVGVAVRRVRLSPARNVGDQWDAGWVTVSGSVPVEHAFDLNIGRVLEHWTVPFAIRELIANALDEQALTDTVDPVITKDESGQWRIADAGRGIRYEHLTQNESAEKRRHPNVIGQFGMGLKDALAVFDRRGVQVAIASPHADITIGRRPKQGFPDVVTLHALVSAPSDPERTGTEVVLGNVTDTDVETAKRLCAQGWRRSVALLATAASLSINLTLLAALFTVGWWNLFQ